MTTPTSPLTAPIAEISEAFDELTKQLATVSATDTVDKAAVAAGLATITAQNTEIAALKAQLAALTPKQLVMWGDAAATEASFKKINLPLLRQYYGPNVIPTTWKSAYPEATAWLLSLKPALDGSQLAALVEYVKSLPEHIRLILQHEPENTDKNITPAQFSGCWNHYAEPILTARPDINLGQCFMCYTLNTRTPGKNVWLTAGATGDVKPGFYMWDGYVALPYKTPAQVFDACRILGETTVPGIEQGIAEVGATGTGAGRAAWFTSLGAYVADRTRAKVGKPLDVVCAWDSAQYNFDNDIATLTAYEADAYAS